MTDDDLEVFRDAWATQRDGLTGGRYVEALCAAGKSDEALVVCGQLWDLRYVIGLTEAAWIARDRGEFSTAIDSMSNAIEQLDGDERITAIGVVGCWRWHHFNDVAAEQQLRVGMRHYGSAWADLGHLLIATERAEEGKRVLLDGAVAGVVECMVPLANLLSRDGDREAAEAMYRRAYELGDGHAAWNLAVDLIEDGRNDEASDWRWAAAALGDEVAIAHLASDDRLD